MPRSSRHKSSKHGPKDVKDYSVSEKDSASKDKRSREEAGPRVLKDSSSADKRKLDSKDAKDGYVAGNGERLGEHGSSKRRREKGDDGTTDRWNGGDDHDLGEGLNSKVSSDLKHKRKDENVGFVGDGEGGKKTAGKEGRHRELSRKEAREDGAEREKKRREEINERTVDSEDHRPTKQVENTTSVVQPVLLYAGSKNQIEGNIRKRRDGLGERNKYPDDTAGVNDRRSKDDSGKDGRQKSEKVKDDKHKEKYCDDLGKEKYCDDLDKEGKHRDDKRRDKHIVKNHVSSRFDDERLKDEKYDGDIQHLKNKTRDGDRDRDYNCSRDWDLDSIRDRDRDRDRRRYRDREDDRKRGRDHSHDHYRDRDYDRGRDRDYDQDSDGDRDRDRDRNRDRGRDLERDRGHDHVDYDGSTVEDRSSKYRSREKKRSSDGCDDYSDVKSISVRVHGTDVDVEKKSSSIDRVDYDAKRGSSQAHSTHTDAFISNNRRRNSPGSISFVNADEYSHPESEDMKYRDSFQELASKTNYSRELTGSSGPLEKGSKYRSIEKLNKTDGGYFGEPFNDRSSSSKASPLGLVDRSPSSASNERRHMNRTGVRRSLDIEETGRRSASIDMREFSNVEDRVNRDLAMEKPLVDESSQVESSFYRVGLAGSSSLGPPAFRSGVDSPSFPNSVEDNFKANSAGRYRRNGDPNSGRMHGNAWRGVANWTAPMPNGFIPFQHGPPHGGFQPMVPQFPAPPLFVRPLEINHSGMPYHISDVERFSSPFRPLGWPNVLDGSGPSNLHGWDGSNGVFMDEPLVYRRAEWDQNGRGWECGAVWKGQNGDLITDMASPSDKDDHGVQAHGDTGPVNDVPHPEDSSHGVLLKKPTDFTSNAATPVKESSSPRPEPVSEKALSPKTSRKNSSFLSRIYLSKIEISADLTSPELYNQCMNLLETEQRLIADDDFSRLKLFKMGARGGLGSSKIIRPPKKDFVFKKAMDLYKKQMMKERDVVFVSEETGDINSPTNDKIVGEQSSPIAVVEKSENPVAVAVAVADVEMSETINSKLETREEEEADQITDLNEVIQELEDNENPDEKLNASSQKIDDVAFQQDVKEAEGGGNESPLLAGSNTQVETPSSFLGENGIVAAEKQAAGDSMKGVFYPDGSSKEREMAGSNECELVIISRIHDSPESTH